MAETQTLGDAIARMNTLVTSEKRRTRLSENTILRVIDMNLAIMQNNQRPPAFPEDVDDSIPLPADDETPTTEDGDDEVIAAVETEQETT